MQLAEGHPHTFPLGEVFRDGDAAALARRLADAEVLFERLARAGNGRLVLSQLRVDVVGSTVDLDRAFEGSRSAVGRGATRLGDPPVVEDIVLGEWLERPAVDSDVRQTTVVGLRLCEFC